MDGTAYIALGSNLGGALGSRRRQLDAALEGLRQRGVTVRRLSTVIETAPMYVDDQPAFLNAVAEVEGPADARALLTVLQEVERERGRERGLRYGPRTLDLDIVLWGADGQGVVDEPDLVVPHPRFAERAFVLEPLAELAPELVPAGYRVTIGELAQRLHVTEDTAKP